MEIEERESMEIEEREPMEIEEREPMEITDLKNGVNHVAFGDALTP